MNVRLFNKYYVIVINKYRQTEARYHRVQVHGERMNLSFEINETDETVVNIASLVFLGLHKQLVMPLRYTHKHIHAHTYIHTPRK